MSIQGHTQGYVRVCRDPEYWPEHVKNGKKTSSRLVIPTMAEEIGYKQEDGSRRKVEDTYMELTCWGKTADTYAKLLGVGKAFFCEFKITSYHSKVYENRKVVHGSDGKPLTKRAYSYSIIPGSIRLGNDGSKLIQKEKSEGTRPIGYDGKITVEELANAINTNTDMHAFLAQVQQAKDVWISHLNSQKGVEYTGGPTYGYAKVRLPEGAECAYSITAVPAAAAGNEPRVDGHSYQDMIAAGWTNEQLLTADNGKWKILVPGSMNTPTPPPATAPVPPPAQTQSFEAAGV